MSVFIDTDICIDFLRGVPKAAAFLQRVESQEEIIISTITESELFA